MKYKIGDKVKIATKKLIPEHWNDEGKMDKWMGKTMTIKEVRFSTFSSFVYRMLEDEKENVGRGWLWEGNMIDGLADEHKIVINTDGKTTTAKLYDGKKFIKEAVAKCSPEDTFDFETGATLAFSRLLGRKIDDVINKFDEEINELKQNRPFSGKAVWIKESVPGLTKGKIYEFKDGQCKCNNGWKIPLTKLTRKEVEAYGFLPIKE